MASLSRKNIPKVKKKSATVMKYSRGLKRNVSPKTIAIAATLEKATRAKRDISLRVMWRTMMR